MAEACIYLMDNFNPTKEQNESWDIFMNIWTSKDITIKELAENIQKIVWFVWKVNWDITKPNGTPRKLQDVSKLEKLWYKYKTELEDWIKISYNWFLENK
jgi:GDP-L-fucose synthase